MGLWTELSTKNRIFCHEYLIDLNAAQAAIRAGYSAKTARVIGYEILNKRHVRRYIQKLMDERVYRMQIDADYVLNSIHEITERCKQGTPVVVDGQPTGEWKFEPHAALKGCELLGKHLKLFTDKVDIGGQKDNPISVKVSFVQDRIPDTE